MRSWWLVLSCTCACSHSDVAPDATPMIDALRPDAGCVDSCDPIHPSSCTTSQRCTWLVDPQIPKGGRSACLAGGAIPANVACTRDASGGDNCVRGATCDQGLCREICDLGGGAPVCSSPMTCRSTALFVTCAGGMPAAGLCLP